MPKRRRIQPKEEEMYAGYILDALSDFRQRTGVLVPATNPKLLPIWLACLNRARIILEAQRSQSAYRMWETRKQKMPVVAHGQGGERHE